MYVHVQNVPLYFRMGDGGGGVILLGVSSRI